MAKQSIQGIVTRAGAPVGGAYVRLHGPSGEFVSEQYTQDEGTFTFFVAEGAWDLQVRATGTADVSQTIEVVGNEVPVHIELI